MSHEEAFIVSFVLPQRRRRYLALLETTKGRTKLVGALDHFADLDSRYTKSVTPNTQTPEQIKAILKEKGAPNTCYLISSNPKLDNREIGLLEALKQTVGQGAGTVISCIPGLLAYFEGEEPSCRYILERPHSM